jgi:photosystem II stability/assembly factor-like uncharacterized protein
MKKYFLIGIILFVIVGVFVFIQRTTENIPNESNTNESNAKELNPVEVITHGHGLAVDIADENTLYIATHHGLLALKNEKDLYQVGSSRDDYMGFSPHPTNSKAFFSSGHPETGGNIGFQKSEDGGFTWRKVSEGVNGPVDFHALTVSPVNSNLIYGWYQGALQKSTNEGKTWEIVDNTDFPVISLAADTKDANIIYAASPQGLFVSHDQGKRWVQLVTGFTSAVAVHPQDQRLISFSEANGLALSSDGGKTWERTAADFAGETPLYIAISKQKPELAYLLTEKNSIYKTMDSGSTWSKIL